MSASTVQPVTLVSPGPVADAFMRSRAFVVVIIGPVGSGKTMAMLQKGVRNGALQGARIDERGCKAARPRRFHRRAAAGGAGGDAGASAA